MSRRLCVAVLGLGEAGAALATDLAGAGWRAGGWDPNRTLAPPGVAIAASARDAVCGTDLVLSVNGAAVALDVAAEVLPSLAPGQLYADLNTGSPALKAELQGMLAGAGAPFADVALLGPVPGNGIRTPALASGSGAQEFARLLGPPGMPVEVIGPEPGAAAGRKLVRSVFMKGLAAAIVECLEAASAADIDEWARVEILRALDSPSEPLVDRLVAGTRAHAARRSDELDAVAAYLSELGVEPRVTRAARGLLEALASKSS